MKIVAIILILVVLLLVIFTLIGAATLRLACRIVDKSITPAFGKAIKIVLISVAAFGVIAPITSYLPLSYPLGQLAQSSLPEVVQQVRVNVLAPIVNLLVEAGILSAMLPTKFARGLLIALMRVVVGWVVLALLFVVGASILLAVMK